MLGPILLRADAGLRTGTGHVMRCIALAQALQGAGAECHFVSASLPPALMERLEENRISHSEAAAEPGSPCDARELTELGQRTKASWIVIDGYHFSSDYQRTIKESSLRLVAIDDYAHAERYSADIVLNPNLYASKSLYDVDERSTRLLLGTQYALLRQEFWSGAGDKSFPESARRLLVTLGGSDPDNVTATVLAGLDLVPVHEGEAVVVVGGSNSHFESLREQSRTRHWKLRTIRDVRNMAELMRWADLAVSASGGTVWELAAMAVPAVIVPIADNQLSVAQSLHERRAAISLGPVKALSAQRVAVAVANVAANRAHRVELSSNARQLVDGKGAQRAAKSMLDLGSGTTARLITIRNATEDDARQLWEWANDPAARAMSFSADPIPWENHVRWMMCKLKDRACRLYIGINEEHEPVGQVRFDIHLEVATLSVSVDTRFRGRGYGIPLIRQASGELFQTSSVRSIEAFVKPINETSRNVFGKAGFVATGEENVQGHIAVRFVLERSMSV